MSAVQKVQVVGLSASAPGAVSKAGKAYSIGQVYCLAPLAAPRSEGGIEKGMASMTYRCEAELVRKVAHLPMPVTVELETETEMVFGKPEVRVIDIRPVETQRKAA